MTAEKKKQQLGDGDYDVIVVDKWECPKDNGVAILTMPNVPKPLHMRAPRTILGNKTWNSMRHYCYNQAHDHCEICGRDCSKEANGKRIAHAHELYSYDYAKQEAVFERCICLCGWPCHTGCIHTGRALTLYKQGNPLFTKEKLLKAAEHCFTIISSFNGAHPEEEPLRVFAVWLDYAKLPELKDEMNALIDKYHIKFYTISEKWYKKKYWKNWRLKIGNKWHSTRFEDEDDWREKVEEHAKQNPYDDHNVVNHFTGGIYDELDKILKGE